MEFEQIGVGKVDGNNEVVFVGVTVPPVGNTPVPVGRTLYVEFGYGTEMDVSVGELSPVPVPELVG